MRMLFLLALAACLAAQEPPKEAGDDKTGYTDTPQLPGQKWKVHDAARPRPRKVAPGMPLLNEAPPADAIVLFNGKDLSQWVSVALGGQPQEPKWKVENGYVEIVPSTRTWSRRRSSAIVSCTWNGWSPRAWKEPARAAATAALNYGPLRNPGSGIVRESDLRRRPGCVDLRTVSSAGQRLSAQRVERLRHFLEAPRFRRRQTREAGVCLGYTQRHSGAPSPGDPGRRPTRRVAKYTARGRGTARFCDHAQIMRYRNIWIRKLRPYDEP